MTTLQTPRLVERCGNRREADKSVEQRTKIQGGVWSVRGTRGDYQVWQELTREQIEFTKRLDSAKMMLSPEFDWLNPKAVMSAYRERDQSKAELDKWAKQFALHPLDAFEWSIATVEEAARHTVLCQIIRSAEEGATADELARYFTRESERQDSYEHLSYSFSPIANLTKQAERIAMRKYAAHLRSYAKARAEAIGTLYEVAEIEAEQQAANTVT